MIASYANDQKVIIQGSAIKPINLNLILASARKPLSPPQVKTLKFKCFYKLTVETELGSQLSTICQPNTVLNLGVPHLLPILSSGLLPWPLYHI